MHLHKYHNYVWFLAICLAISESTPIKPLCFRIKTLLYHPFLQSPCHWKVGARRRCVIIKIDDKSNVKDWSYTPDEIKLPNQVPVILAESLKKHEAWLNRDERELSVVAKCWLLRHKFCSVELLAVEVYINRFVRSEGFLVGYSLGISPYT